MKGNGRHELHFNIAEKGPKEKGDSPVTHSQRLRKGDARPWDGKRHKSTASSAIDAPETGIDPEPDASPHSLRDSDSTRNCPASLARFRSCCGTTCP